ncbi:MAG: catalase family peroxidase [Dokdonella sp.]
MSKHLLAAALTAAFAATAPIVALADSADVNTQIVDAFNKNFGVHPGYRANHAKGVVAEGSFTATPAAAGLTKSPIFAGGKIPVTVRFSDAGGLPDVHDGAGDASPHGLAIKFHLPGGADSDIVVNSLKFFPVATPEEFRDLQVAAAEAPKGPPSEHLKAFLQSHPSVGKAIGTLGTPASFASEHYYGINAFVFTNKDGKTQAFRYLIEPVKLDYLKAEDAAKKSPDYLVQDLPQRLAKGPVTFHVKAQLAAPGDPINDATQAWPDDRKLVDMGTLTITKAAADSLAEQKKLLFLPGRLTDGIAPSDDPLIAARNAAYGVSFGRRSANP